MNAHLIELAGSAVVVAFMIGMAALLGFRQRARIDADGLARRIAEAEPGARVLETAIDEQGRSALALLGDGRLAAVQVMGDGLSLRIFSPAAMALRKRDGQVYARFADVGFPSLNMRLSQTPLWLQRIAAQGAKT